jgi:PAS domain S-box-containing protein
MSESKSQETIIFLHRMARQRTLLILLLSMALTAGTIYFSYHTATSADWSILQNNEKTTVKRAQYRSSAELTAVISDVAYLSQEGYLQEWLAHGTEAARHSLEKEYLAFVREKELYDQIRLIDKHGQEIVRVDQGPEGPLIARKEELQDKSDRYYVTETLSLDRGQIYVSPLDLNVEHGVIEQPIKPMARIGMPLFDNEGRNRGAIILNYKGLRVLDRIQELASQSAGNLWLLNTEGYWLIGPSREDEWAFMYPGRRDRSFAHDYPAVWETISRRTGSAQFLSNGDLFTSTTIHPTAEQDSEQSANVEHADPLPRETWIVLSHVPAAVIAAQRQPQIFRFATIFGVIALLEIVAAGLVFRHWIARQAAELAADRSEKKFRSLLEAAPDGIVVTDLAGKIVLVNSQTERLLGYERSQLVGRLVDVLVPRSRRGQHVELRTRYSAAPTARRLGGGNQLWAARSDGTELPVDVSLSPVVSDGEGLVYASVRDVTDRYQKERTIQEMAERLARDNAALNSVNKELDTFCYSVSHDLRAPLRGMVGFCQALVEDYGDKLDETGKDYVQRISAASKRMGQLIDDLLTLSRVTRTEINRADVNLSNMAETIAEQLRRSDSDRKVEFKIQPGLTAQGDETLLRTMLENLLGNAWKYSAKKPHATIEFGIAANGTEQPFFVRDNGAGFDMAHVDKLFKPFQRLHGHREFEGTGIGLASVANIVRRHGGRIWAEAKPEAGATMRFTLPT